MEFGFDDFVGIVWFVLEMKVLKDDCEWFEVFLLGYIYLSKVGWWFFVLVCYFGC